MQLVSSLILATGVVDKSLVNKVFFHIAERCDESVMDRLYTYLSSYYPMTVFTFSITSIPSQLFQPMPGYSGLYTVNDNGELGILFMKAD